MPKCVEWCLAEALVYEEREEEVEEEPGVADIEISVEALIDKYGLQHVLDSVSRRAKP
jgi:benzoyl-CoA reductase subunit BamC